MHRIVGINSPVGNLVPRKAVGIANFDPGQQIRAVIFDQLASLAHLAPYEAAAPGKQVHFSREVFRHLPTG